MEEKLFHPAMYASTVKELDSKHLDLCATFLHDMGWFAQKGSFEQGVKLLRWWHEHHPEAFLKACANGLTLILDALPQNEPEPPSGTARTLHFLD